jgi:peptidyl-prolyl cis-trans isomerase SurA
MLKYINLTCLLLAVTLAFHSNTVKASDYEIIAVVNGEAISNIQLKDRVDLIISSSGMDDNLSNRKNVAKDAYNILINEVLQAQEAASKGIELTEDDIDYALTDLERKNRIPEGKFKDFIRKKGLSYEASLEQIKAGLLWKKTISKFFRNKVEVTEDDIRSAAAEYSADDVLKTVNISEIVIPLNYDNTEATKQQAKDIVEQARNKEASFEKLARQYSVGKTAKAGGRIGWIKEDTVMPALKKHVKKLGIGEISDPIFIDDLYVIIKKNDRKVYDPANDEKGLREKAMMEKLENQAKRYVKELRQKALIEKRVLPEEIY